MGWKQRYNKSNQRKGKGLFGGRKRKSKGFGLFRLGHLFGTWGKLLR